MDKPLKTKRVTKPPIRLVWAEAGSITPNPRNWRTHPEAQLRAVDAMITDPDLGWAGAALYNEKTGRLIDGHARVETRKSRDLVPVLVGSWSEAAEAKLLARLDPSTMMAGVDVEALQGLVEDIGPGGADFAELDAMLANMIDSEDATDPSDGSDNPPKRDREIEVGAQFAVVVDCENEQDQQRAYELLTEAGFACRVNTIN